LILYELRILIGHDLYSPMNLITPPVIDGAASSPEPVKAMPQWADPGSGERRFAGRFTFKFTVNFKDILQIRGTPLAPSWQWLDPRLIIMTKPLHLNNV
jgi:hypothetical protein